MKTRLSLVSILAALALALCLAGSASAATAARPAAGNHHG